MARVLLALAALLAAALVFRRALEGLRWSELTGAFAALPAWKLGASATAALASLVVLGSFDVFAAATAVPGRVAPGWALFTGTVSHAISNTLGLHALTGGAARYRLYLAAGLGAGDVARVVALVGLAVALGFATTLALVLWCEPTAALGAGRGTGLVLTLLLGGLLAWLARRPRRLALAGHALALPGAGSAARQMVLGVVEMVTAILALYVLLPGPSLRGFVDFVPLYVAAVLLGVATQVPGGVGVFEATLLAALPAVGRAELLAALLCYRVLYGLLPFGLATAALAATEGRRWRRRRGAEGRARDGGDA